MKNDRLIASLTLDIGDSSLEIPAGAIETIDIDAHTWGFTADVRFWVSSEGVDDELFDPFTSTDIAKATLAIANGRIALEGETPVVATFMGYVVDRWFEETSSEDIEGEPIIERLYSVRFVDPAQAFFRRHRPLGLFAGASIKEMIDANLVLGVTIEYDWPRLEESNDIVCIGLGALAKASFYDFLMWIVDDLCGVIELDAASGTYRLGKDKADGESATDLDAQFVESIRILSPKLVRRRAVVLNPFTEATAASTDVANSLAATGVRTDVIKHTPIASEVEARAKLEADRLRQPDHHIEVTLDLLPPEFPVPGVKHKIGDGFSKRLYCSSKTYRCIRFVFKAQSPEGEDSSKMEDGDAVFGVEIKAEFERETDPVPVLPPFEPPRYPVLVEGKVLSASGAETDRTWHALSDEEDSVFKYRIHIPLWNKTIVAPFVPFGESGHFFFPAYKNQRVLVAFGFDSAKIVSFLDWAGRLSTETQGNQLIMGKRETSSTVMKHVYTDNSPILTLVRTQAGDKQTMELSEGRFFLEVKEDESEEETEETADLTPEAEIAKEQASSETNSKISEVGSQYESDMGATKSALTSTKDEVESEVFGATEDLSMKVSDVETELSDQAASAGDAADELTASIDAAKAELDKALEDD